MNIPKLTNLKEYFATPKPIETRAGERYRQFEYDGKGLMKQRLFPKQQDELNAKLAEAARARDTMIDEAASKREAKLREIKATYETARKLIDNEHRQTQATANAAFEATEDRLHAEYARPLSDEEIALLVAKPGEVVRMPSPVPVAEPAGA